jgi:hypothetical protein
MDEFIVFFLDDKRYDVTIKNYLRCSCDYFVTMLEGSLGGCGMFVQCKHVYRFTDNYVLWVHGRVHSSLQMELG